MEGFKFRRQHSIGGYIVDFCCNEMKLIIELDGGQHLEDPEREAERTQDLKQKGYRVLRFWDHDVLQDIEVVLEAIRLHLYDPHPSPLPGREREKKMGVRRRREILQ